MPTIINASQTSGLVMTSDLSGQLQFQNNGVNLPMGGVAPAFSAYSNASQSITSGVVTKVSINTKIFDTNNNFDNATNYRFTPTVAGYYQVNAVVRVAGTAITSAWAGIYKNGSLYARGNEFNQTIGTSQLVVSNLIYLNGSTDYIELYGIVSATSGQSFDYANTTATSFFSACLVRGA